MPGRVPIKRSKTYTTPRRPFEKERLDQELKLIGEFGLRNKREVWRVKYTLGRVRKAARELLTLDEKDQRRLFEGIRSLNLFITIRMVVIHSPFTFLHCLNNTEYLLNNYSTLLYHCVAVSSFQVMLC